MAKATVNPNTISAEYTNRMRETLDAAQMSPADIDKLIAKSGVETILTQKNLGQYFRNAQSYLEAITNRFNENKALSAAGPDMSDYMAYWGKDLDTHRGVPGVDFIPSGYQKNLQNFLLNPDLMAQWVGFNEREKTAYQVFLYGPPVPPQQGAPAPGAPAPSQGGSPDGGGGYGGGSYGGGGGKAMSTGGNYGSGSKNLGAPPPPPGMGGGYPPGGGYGGGYGGGGYQSQNMNFFPQAEWDWAMQNVQGMPGADWLGPLFGSQQKFREVTANGVEQLNQIDQFQRQIMTEFGTLDLTTPEGQRRQFMLTNELQNINGKKQEIMDKMMRIQRMNDELITGLKGLKEKAEQDIMAIVRNSRPGG